MNSHCTPELRKRFEKILSDNRVVIITKLGYTSCKKIEKLLKDNSIDYFEADMTHPDYKDLYYCVKEKTKSRFVPLIFLNADYIGGYTEGLNYFVQGKLNKI